MRACAVIVAGGSGTRFGGQDGKLMIEVAGKPLITWTLEAFDAARQVERIVVVCPPERADDMRRRAIDPFDLATPLIFAPSGEERQDSTRNGLQAVPAEFDIVLVHDAARPLIRPATIDGAVRALIRAGRPGAGADTPGGPVGRSGTGADPSLSAEAGAVPGGLDGVVCGQPSVDTLKVVDSCGCFAHTPPRSQFWTVQTPQVFWVDSLRCAYGWVERTGFVGTDDASLVEGMGGRVQGFEAPRDNLKVTLPEDLIPVEAILRDRL